MLLPFQEKLALCTVVFAFGDFVIGPEYVTAPETKVIEGVQQGKVQQFQIDSKDCKLFNPGIAGEVFGTVDPNNPKTLIVETHPIDYKRTISVYLPAQYFQPVLPGRSGAKVGRTDIFCPFSSFRVV